MLSICTAVTVKVSAQVEFILKFEKELDSMNIIAKAFIALGGIVLLGRPVRRHILLRYISSKARTC